jgi:hypothetical protein
VASTFICDDSEEPVMLRTDGDCFGETGATHGDVRLGFVYERVPHIMLKSLANNIEIDIIWRNGRRRWGPCAKSSTPCSVSNGSYSDTSRLFEKPKSGRIAVKVINHLGDEVMKVFAVG